LTILQFRQTATAQCAGIVCIWVQCHPVGAWPWAARTRTEPRNHIRSGPE